MILPLKTILPYTYFMDRSFMAMAPGSFPNLSTKKALRLRCAGGDPSGICHSVPLPGALWILRLFDSTDTAKRTSGLLLYSVFSGIWIFLFSVSYRLAMDYFALSRRQNEMAAEKARTELHLLKQQVHPHFLFNTLNNIYYVLPGKARSCRSDRAPVSDWHYFIDSCKMRFSYKMR